MLFVSISANGEVVKHHQGDKSLNFSFNGLELSNDGFGVGAKIWNTDKRVFTGSFNINKNERVQEYRDTFGASSNDNDARSYGFSLGIENHFGKSLLVSPYYGARIGYSFAQFKSQSGANSANGHQWGVNIGALLGVEYYLDAAISLAAEYSFSYSYFKNRNSSGTRFDESTNKRFGFGSGLLKLMIYF